MRHDGFPATSVSADRLAYEETRLVVERLRAVVRSEGRRCAEPFDYGNRVAHELEVQLLRLPEQHTVSATWPATWWQHLKADLGAWLMTKSHSRYAPIWCRKWADRLAESVRWEQVAWTASKLFLDPLPPGLNEHDSFCVFSPKGLPWKPKRKL